MEFDYESASTEQFRRAWTAALLVATSAVAVTALGFYMRTNVGNDVEPVGMIPAIFLGLAVMEAFVPMFLPKVQIRQAQQGLAAGTMSPEQVVGSVAGIVLARAGLAEMPALLAFVLNAMGAPLPWVALLLAISAVMFVAYFPREAQMREWLEESWSETQGYTGAESRGL